MLNDSVLTALHSQLGHELINFHKYKSFAGIADFLGFTGTCSWFEKQSTEEYVHFDKIYKYISDQGHIPIMPSLPEIPPQLLTLPDLFTQTVLIEKETTDKLKLVSAICKEANDDQTYELMLWFLKEQVEEEKIVGDILKRTLISTYNYLIIDQELSKR